MITRKDIVLFQPFQQQGLSKLPRKLLQELQRYTARCATVGAEVPGQCLDILANLERVLVDSTLFTMIHDCTKLTE